MLGSRSLRSRMRVRAGLATAGTRWRRAGGWVFCSCTAVADTLHMPVTAERYRREIEQLAREQEAEKQRRKAAYARCVAQGAQSSRPLAP